MRTIGRMKTFKEMRRGTDPLLYDIPLLQTRKLSVILPLLWVFVLFQCTETNVN